MAGTNPFSSTTSSSSSLVLLTPPFASPPTFTQHTFSVKLTSKTYLSWKTQFLPLLNSQNLTGFVDGTFSPPPKIIPSSEDYTSFLPNPEY